MNDSLPELPEYLEKLLEQDEGIDEIFLDKDGKWFHNGILFENSRIIDFFNRHINITKYGIYVIHYGDYTYPVKVEDVPVFISGVIIKGFGTEETVTMNLSLGIEEELDPETLRFKNNHLYCTVCSGKFPAKFKRSPSFHILERLDEYNGKYYITLCGKKILLQKDEE